jgi:hypothetical protein
MTYDRHEKMLILFKVSFDILYIELQVFCSIPFIFFDLVNNIKVFTPLHRVVMICLLKSNSAKTHSRAIGVTYNNFKMLSTYYSCRVFFNYTPGQKYRAHVFGPMRCKLFKYPEKF